MLGQITEHLARVFPEMAREPFSAALRDGHDRELASRLDVALSVFVTKEASFFRKKYGFERLRKGGDNLAIFLMIRMDNMWSGMGPDCVWVAWPRFETIV